jgi:hypothetical protein
MLQLKCIRACVRARVCVCVCVRVRARARVRVRVRVCVFNLFYYLILPSEHARTHARTDAF